VKIKRWFVISIARDSGIRTEATFASFALFAPLRFAFFTNPRGLR
jgi:hypothetical protein